MLKEKLKDLKIILASGSSRRQEYFRQLGLNFEVRLKEVEETYPADFKGAEITEYLAKLKADAFLMELNPDELLVTCDTLVWHKDRALGKPTNHGEAFAMIKSMSDQWHEVITSVCFTSEEKQRVETCITKVRFKELDDNEINYYINNFKPFDKAGAYGIQEWIGHIGISEIQGSYTNVVGLPTHLVYKMLIEIMG